MLELTDLQARVLGALIEKSRTTPDYYPMTINALTAACNQASNRQPVTSYSEEDVAEAMHSLRARGVARSVRTARSRIMKHRHDLEKALVLQIPSTSLLAVLLLRGPQTVGELKARTARYHGFDDLDTVETSLEKLAEDDPPLVQRLPRQPGHKEARWVQLLTAHSPQTGSPQPTAPSPASDVALDPGPTVAPPAPRDLEDRVALLESRVEDLERHLGL